MEDELPLEDQVAPSAVRARRSPLLRLYLVLIPVAVVGFVVIDAVAPGGFLEEVRTGAPWILALFLAEMFPVPVWRDIQISLGYPLIMFMAVLFQPATVGLFALVGSGDPREFTGRSDFVRSLFNRSQVAAAGLAASAVFHAIVARPHLGPGALGGAVAASAAQLTVNMVLVGIAARLDYGVRFLDVIRKMPVGNVWRFETAYLGVGLLGAVMALVYLDIGVWAMVGLVLPLIAVRHLLKLSSQLERTQSELRRETALQEVSEQLATERHRERQRLAGVLHDEVSPQLTSANLNLEGALGRLDGTGDPKAVGQITSAIEAGRTAQQHVRGIIGELLQSPTGPAGLTEALGQLLTEIREEHHVAVRQQVEAINAPQTVRELLFGIAREAARNAVHHGHPHQVEVSLREDDGRAVLTVTDDGEGFDVERAQSEDKYGLRLLLERTETCGGHLTVSSKPGEGTVVIAEVPLTLP